MNTIVFCNLVQSEADRQLQHPVTASRMHVKNTTKRVSRTHTISVHESRHLSIHIIVYSTVAAPISNMVSLGLDSITSDISQSLQNCYLDNVALGPSNGMLLQTVHIVALPHAYRVANNCCKIKNVYWFLKYLCGTCTGATNR